MLAPAIVWQATLSQSGGANGTPKVGLEPSVVDDLLRRAYAGRDGYCASDAEERSIDEVGGEQ